MTVIHKKCQAKVVSQHPITGEHSFSDEVEIIWD